LNPHSYDSPLGEPTVYESEYSPGTLYAIPRIEDRAKLGITGEPPFSGTDVWNAYEISWLNMKGKPVAATAEFRFPASSPNIIESKSLKRYLNSLTGTRYESTEAVRTLVCADLGAISGADAGVKLFSLSAPLPYTRQELPGTCMDNLDIAITQYEVEPDLLLDSVKDGTQVSETLHSHLLKSNCPVTSQPDWASILIRYRGPKIDRARLLSYLVSYRNHHAFHEHCIERIFIDIQRHCQPRALTVQAYYTRRGGLDINPFRSTFEEQPDRTRLLRQ